MAVALRWDRDFDIGIRLLPILLYWPYMLFFGIMSIRHRRNPSKTKMLRTMAAISFILLSASMYFGMFRISILFVLTIIIGMILSILITFAAVKDESFLKHAPGSIFLKSAGVYHLVIALISSMVLFNVLAWYVRHGFTHVILGLAIISISYVCFHVLAGIIGIMFNKKPEKAGLLRDFSIVGILLYVCMIFVTNSLRGPGPWHWMSGTEEFNFIAAIFGFLPATLFLIGATKNLKASALPKQRPHIASIIAFMIFVVVPIISIIVHNQGYNEFLSPS